MRKINFLLYLLTALALFLSVTAFDCGGGSGGTNTGGNAISPEVAAAAKLSSGEVPISQNPNYRAPCGVTIHGQPQLSAADQNAICAGIQQSIDEAKASMPNVDQRPYAPSFYHVYLPTNGCSPSPESQTPSFLLRADDYDATNFDFYNSKGAGVKDGIGVIYAPERVFGIGTFGSTPEFGQMLICPTGDIKTFAKYGAEHILIANEDPVYHQATAFHGNGVSHPLLPKPAGWQP